MNNFCPQDVFDYLRDNLKIEIKKEWAHISYSDDDHVEYLTVNILLKNPCDGEWIEVASDTD